MAHEYVFVPISGKKEIGKEKNIIGWKQFFETYPDYRNIFQRVEQHDNEVICIGYSICSEPALDGPAIWVAKIVNNLVTEWRIYEDTEENRKTLQIF
jgi:hypothetical protein